MKTPVIIANWKMNKSIGESVEYACRLNDLMKEITGVEVILAVPFTALRSVSDVLNGGSVSLAAQNIHWEDCGPYTGEVSAPQVREAGASYVILGHSERRQSFGEGNESVHRKVQAAFKHQLAPVVCVGESESERQNGRALEVIEEQMVKGLGGLKDVQALLIAYEPVWAIGTGRTVTREQVSVAHQWIREKTAEILGPGDAGPVRVLYGGSVTAENTSEFLAEPEVEGLLIGGSSLRFEVFSDILKHSARCRGN